MNVISRRKLFQFGAVAGFGVLAGCNQIQVAQPPRYTPPPPGLDESARALVLKELGSAQSQLAALAKNSGGQSMTPAQTGVINALQKALSTQRKALLTGAEAAKPQEVKAAETPDLPALIKALGHTRDLAAIAALQTSADVARLLTAVAASLAMWLEKIWQNWKLATPPLTDKLTEKIVDENPVPVTVASTLDFTKSLHRCISDEYFAIAAWEALAARESYQQPQLENRKAFTARAQLNQERLNLLLEICAKNEIKPPQPQATYRFHSQPLNAEDAAALPGQVAQTLASDWVLLTGEAPLAEREAILKTAIKQAQYTQVYLPEPPALVGLTTP